VPDDEIGSDVGSLGGEIDLVTFLGGATAHEHLVALVKADSPPERGSSPTHT
jgi:hypothetical protein